VANFLNNNIFKNTTEIRHKKIKNKRSFIFTFNLVQIAYIRMHASDKIMLLH